MRGAPSPATKEGPFSRGRVATPLPFHRVTTKGPRTENLALSMLVREPLSFNVYHPPREEEETPAGGDEGDGGP